MATVRERLEPASIYDEDFYGWALEQAALLRARRFEELDVANLAEEVEDLARSEERELESRFIVLVAYLLKWQVQPEHRSCSWVGTIEEQRGRIRRRLSRTPGLQRQAPQLFGEVYADAVSRAMADTNLPRQHFPASCPFTLDQALDPTFWPGPPWQGFAEG